MDGMEPAAGVPEGRLAAGAVLNGLYRVEALIGRGGMGEVYRAVNVANDEPEAIKVLAAHLARSPQIEALFRREARVLRTLSHPAVAQYRMIGRDAEQDVLYIVTEFVDGPPLGDWMVGRPAKPAEITTLGVRLAEGLRAAHALGAVHRDLSPDNVLLPAGRLEAAKIIDFGIAKDLDPVATTVIGDGFAGKLAFAAPEQFGAEGARVGPWTDVYTLALVLLSVAAGKPVDMGQTLATAMERRRVVPDLGPLPAALRPLFSAMLEPEWSKRLQSMEAVLEGFRAPPAAPAPTVMAPTALLHAAAAETTRLPEAGPPPTADPAPPPSERPRARRGVPGFALWGSALAGVAAVAALALTLHHPAAPAAAPSAAPPPQLNVTAATPTNTLSPPATAPDPQAPTATPQTAFGAPATIPPDGDDVDADPGARTAGAPPAPPASPTVDLNNPDASYSFPTHLDPSGDNWLALKSQPGGGGERIAKLGPQARFIVGERQGDWVRVHTTDGREGWVSVRYIACCAGPN